ncbi:hypothetical protein [Planctobacterium marinum]|uniref:2-keto-4-pentenoate hydratase n=1 Tax=Planctobacterium marinum TaxID=1631968 RepID=UPI0030C76AF8
MLKVSAFICLWVSSVVHSACLSPQKVSELVAGYPTHPVSGLSVINTLSDAYCSQNRYLELLKKQLGDVKGYKVGFTSKAGQQRFKIASPATGALLERMFIPNNSKVPLDYGFRTLIEPDFMVIIADNGIMQANSARDTLQYVASIHPFIELVAMQLAPEEPVTGNRLVAINIAATKALMGEAIEVQDNDEFYQQIPFIEAVFSNDKGEVIQKTDAQALMGHPLEVLFWLIKDFQQRGLTLKAGDKVSLGATGKLYPISAEPMTYHYHFSGLSQEPALASVSMVKAQ